LSEEEIAPTKSMSVGEDKERQRGKRKEVEIKE